MYGRHEEDVLRDGSTAVSLARTFTDMSVYWRFSLQWLWCCVLGVALCQATKLVRGCQPLASWPPKTSARSLAAPFLPAQLRKQYG